MNNQSSSGRGANRGTGRTGRSTENKSGRPERGAGARSAKPERSTSAERSERPERAGSYSKSTRSEKSGPASRSTKPERSESATRSERPGSYSKSTRSEKGGTASRSTKPERSGSASRSERPERGGTFSKSARPERGTAASRTSRSSAAPSGKRIGKSKVAASSVEPKREFAPRSFSKGRKVASREKVPASKTLGDDGMRLNRFIANAGVCSRREADTYIAAGVVTINGKQVIELGTRVKPGDEVRFDGRLLSAEKKVYLLLNKPKDFVTSTDDPHADRTVMDLIKNACDERIYPVGRLDRNTTGLLLFTNDGDMSKKLTHPSHNMKKIYQVSLEKPLTKADMEQIAAGVELEDGIISADAISYIAAEDKTEIGIEIHSGRNRIVRRIFEHLGYRVKKLDRVFFAGLTKKNLPRGKYRFLSEKEIKFLKMI